MMNIKQPALAFLLIAAIAPAFAQDQASITLGETSSGQGITLKEPDGAATSVVTKGGKEARSTQPSSGQTGGFMYFDVDNTFAHEGSVQDLYVTVEYFDEGADQFELDYDSVGSGVDPEADSVKPAQGGARLSKYDTKKWLTYTFHLPDAYFGNREPGDSDFRINDLTWDDVNQVPVDGEGPEIIRSITLSKTEPNPLHIKYASGPIKLDGKLDDPAWANATSFQLNSAAQDVIRPSAWQGPSDYTLNAKLLWDNDYLYLGFDVTDDAPRVNNDNGGQAWMGDGVEVYLGYDQSQPNRTAYIQGEDFQLVMTAGQNPTWGVFSSGANIYSPMEGDPYQPQDHLVIADSPTGYVLEARVPWGMLSDADGNPHKAPVPGQSIGFDIFGNDGDDPSAPNQEIAMGLTGRPGAWGNPSAWESVVMDPPAASGGGTAVKPGDLNGDGSVNVQDATISLRIAVGLLTPTDAQKAAGDANHDGSWNVQDATLILRAAVGLGTLS
jgi:hypothetical protein